MEWAKSGKRSSLPLFVDPTKEKWSPLVKNLNLTKGKTEQSRGLYSLEFKLILLNQEVGSGGLYVPRHWTQKGMSRKNRPYLDVIQLESLQK